MVGLSSFDPHFPIGKWDRLLDQSEMTLNLLCTSRCNPNISAHSYINRINNFNKEPLVPPGTNVIVNQKPKVQKSWGCNGKIGWYVGLVKQHYKYYQVFIPETAPEIIIDKLQFLSNKIPPPTTTVDNHLKFAIDNTVTWISSNILRATLLQQQILMLLRDAFIKIATLLNNNQSEVPYTTDDKNYQG